MQQPYCFNGKCLLPNEISPMEANCIQLKLNERFQNVSFWGKIYAERRDYIILQAKSFNHFEIVKKWFFSEDEGLNFAELPPMEDWMRERCCNLFSPLTGTSSFIHKEEKKVMEENEEEAEKEEENPEENEEQKPVEEGPTLTELHRLAYIVNEISFDCFIAPSQSIRLTSKKEFIKEVNYTGLSREESENLNSYVHLRQPELEKIYNANTFTETNEVLDKIVDDMPPNVWRTFSKNNGFTIIKNLKWPGFEFKITAYNNQFMQGYFGDGIPRNKVNWLISQGEN